MYSRKLHITTFGCQMNVYDSGRLSELMRLKGWTMAKNQSDADFIFVNTCSIREKAARRVIGHLHKLKAMKYKNPNLIFGVGGCVAEQEGQNLLTEVPWLNLVVGPGRLDEIPDVVDALTASMPAVILSGRRPDESPSTPLGPVIPMASPKASPDFSVDNAAASETGPISAFLTIMQGCDNYCAYCVVPYLRGPETSRPHDEVVAEAAGLIARGAREITLLGQNVNSYSRTSSRRGLDFVKLLQEVDSLAGLSRLRFTTSHPKDFPPELVELFGCLTTLCEHLHLPLQAGSDKILSAMGRRYNRQRYLNLVDELRRACPDLALSTDIIVGFPGETESDFQCTMEMLDLVRFDSIYSFKYSDRPMTAAMRLPDKIDEDIKARRLNDVQQFQKTVTVAKHRSMVGRRLEVLVEGFGRRNGQLTGRSRDLKPVNFDGPPELIGRLVTVEVTEGFPASLLGVLQDDPPR
ncbi:MAG: tRNA (N6-isopentenyl adenosine(37)-C2)-methylthiotransferase MiaB [Deltaproteobacteria bacterium]|jgi:tRNA-2-methylthio-N6-dimethylallyladenosine synthase|nr:tRNA (N6-isopentenyl adenosine(37)-C2)-methylthiotransferase MiaB [Deltaproteobacteria bacterium]